jgi:hypothetical protein
MEVQRPAGRAVSSLVSTNRSISMPILQGGGLILTKESKKVYIILNSTFKKNKFEEKEFEGISYRSGQKGY